MGKPEDRASVVNAAGFLFQLAVEHEVQGKREDHGWEVSAREHYWQNKATQESGFIDLVLGSNSTRMVIECKKARDQSWIFLVPEEAKKLTEVACLFWTNQGNKQVLPDSPDYRDLYGWTDMVFHPSSYEAAFCIPEKDKSADKLMLETVAGKLLRSTEQLALSELGMYPLLGPDEGLRYISAIVTTAELLMCRFSLKDIKLERGELPVDWKDFEAVDWIWFRKALPTDVQIDKSGKTLRDANRLDERSVLVINGSKLTDLLTKVSLSFARRIAPWQRSRNRQ